MVKKRGGNVPSGVGKPYSLSDGITNSLLQAWCDCRVRARYVLQGWQRDVEKRALGFGSLMHRLLELHHGGGCTLSGALRDEVGMWRKKAIADGQPAQEVESDCGLATLLFRAYAEHYAGRDQGKEWVGLETKFDLQWADGWRLRGKRDGLYKLKGKLWLFETKTTSQINDQTYQLALSVDPQIRFYALATTAEREEAVVGVTYNLIRKPSIKQGNDTLPGWLERVAADVAAKPETYFVRYEVKFHGGELLRYADELRLKLRAFQEWVDGGMKPTWRNEEGCVKRWNCSYLEACASCSMRGYNQKRKLFQELEEEG